MIIPRTMLGMTMTMIVELVEAAAARATAVIFNISCIDMMQLPLLPRLGLRSPRLGRSPLRRGLGGPGGGRLGDASTERSKICNSVVLRNSKAAPACEVECSPQLRTLGRSGSKTGRLDALERVEGL